MVFEFCNYIETKFVRGCTLVIAQVQSKKIKNSSKCKVITINYDGLQYEIYDKRFYNCYEIGDLLPAYLWHFKNKVKLRNRYPFSVIRRR